MGKVIDKLMGGRWLAMMFLVITACVGFLKGMLSAEFFSGLVGGAVTGYQLRDRSGEKPEVKTTQVGSTSV